MDVELANKDVNQNSAPLLLTPAHDVKSLSCSVPTSKMELGMQPGEGSGTGKTHGTHLAL